MRKRILSLILALAMMFSLAATVSVTASAESSGDYEYELLDDGTIEITSYNGNTKTLDIPGEIDGKEVSGIGYGAFGSCNLLTSVTIPDSVTTIDNNAFILCGNLKSIALPSNITSNQPKYACFLRKP